MEHVEDRYLHPFKQVSLIDTGKQARLQFESERVHDVT